MGVSVSPGTRAAIEGSVILRILLIVFNQVGMGTFRRASHFGMALAERGHAVTLMAVSPNARLRLCVRDLSGVKLVETPDLFSGSLRSGWDPWNVLRRVLWLNGQSFEIVHAIESRPVVLLPALIARRRGAKLIMDWCDWFGQGGSVEERPNPLVRAVLRPVETFFEEHFRTRADGTLVINTFLREKAIALGVPPNRVEVIYDGADTRFIPQDRIESRRATGLPGEAPLIGYAGRIYTFDAALMASAFNRVLKSVPDARLVLVGYFNRNIEALLDCPEAVIRTGWLTAEQVFQYLAACDVCWLPLRDTGANRGRWPSKLCDYLTAGRPVVATAVGDLSDLIPRYRVGIVTLDNPDDFARCTAEMLSDRDRCDTMGRAARRAAEDVFNWTLKVDELEDFYKRVLRAH